MATELTAFQGVKISDLATDPAFDDTRLSLSADPTTGKLYRVTISQWVNLLTGVSVAFQGSAVAATDPGTPTTGVYYTATEAGTYTNFGGLAVTTADLENNLVQLIYTLSDTTWSKLLIPISVDLSAYSKTSDVMLRDDYLYMKNLADKSTITAGAYNNLAVKSTSVNWISIKIPVKPSTDYTISGIASASASTQRFVFIDGDNAVISGSDVASNATPTQTVTTPATAAYACINIANETNIGVDPTAASYAATIQFELGDSATSYVPYGALIDATKIFGIDTKVTDAIAADDTINSVVDFKDNIEYQGTNLFNSETAIGALIGSDGAQSGHQDNWVCSDYEPALPATQYSGKGYKNNTNTNLAFAFYDSDKNFISGVAMSGATQYTTTSPAGTAYMRQTLGNILGAGVDPQSNSIVQAFMVNVGNPMDWEPYLDSGLVDAKKVHGLDSVISAPCYVSYNKTGSPDGKELFTVYLRRSGTDNYIGITVQHDYDMSELVYTDQFRIGGAGEYKYQNGAMVDLSMIAMVAGESECVWQRDGAADFTGGWHGDEIYSTVKFLVDGVALTSTQLASNFDLMACQKFEYFQVSTMHQTTEDGTTPITGHPTQCTHNKHTTFEDGGYSTFNRLTWEAGIPVEFWYHGICCFGKIQATAGIDEQFTTYAFTGTTDHTYITGPRKMTYWDTDNDLGGGITSTLLKPSADDPTCIFQLWDRADDSKYYRQYPSNLTTAGGEVWESIMDVKFT